MKSVVVHALLALAGLAFAYQTWTREEEEERPEGEVTVLDCKPEELTKLSIENPTHVISVEPVKDGDARVYWISTQRKREEKKEEQKPKEGAETAAGKSPTSATPAGEAKHDSKHEEETENDDDEAAEEAPPKPSTIDESLYEPKRFLASVKFKDYLAMVTPMRAARGLGEIPQSKFEQFGFDKVGTFLRVQCGGKALELDVGGRTFGSGMQYLRDPKTKQVYLSDAGVTHDLESAQYKFMQIELHDFAPTDIDEAVVRARGTERRLLHRNRQVVAEARWVDKAEPDRRNETFGNWFSRLDRLRVTSYLAPKAEPGSDLKQSGQVTPAVTIDYLTDGKPKGKLELVRVDADGKGNYYARTEATRVWTRVYDSIAKQIEEDAALVVGVEQPAEANAAPQSAPPAGSSAAARAKAPTTASAPSGKPPAGSAKAPTSAPAPSARPPEGSAKPPAPSAKRPAPNARPGPPAKPAAPPPHPPVKK